MSTGHDNIGIPRILHVLGGLFHGGAEALVMNYYRNLDPYSMQFDFIVHTPVVGVYEAEIQSRGGRIFRAPTYTGRNHLQYRAWWKRFLQEHPQYHIVHFHIRGSSAIAIPLVKRAGRVTIIHSHSISNGKTLTAQIKSLFQLSLRRNADYLFACSENAGSWLFGKKAMREGRVQIWKNSIDLAAYQKALSMREALPITSMDRGIRVFGHVGRFVEAKNHRFLLEIFNEIHKRNSNTFLLLIGDGPLLEEIKRYATHLGIEQAVAFLGARDDIPQLLKSMDVFLFPSKFEGLGIVAIEAQAAGIPTLVSTAVPREVAVTHLVSFVDQRATSSVWAEQALSSANNKAYEEDRIQLLQETGYDIVNSTKQICEFYLQALHTPKKYSRES